MDCLDEGITVLLPCEVELHKDVSPAQNVGYPAGNETYVTLGTVFRAQVAKDVGFYILNGYSGELPEEIQELVPSDTDIAHITGPLGQAVYGKGVGVESIFKVRSRPIGVKVLEIYQLDGTNPIVPDVSED